MYDPIPAPYQKTPPAKRRTGFLNYCYSECSLQALKKAYHWSFSIQFLPRTSTSLSARQKSLELTHKPLLPQLHPATHGYAVPGIDEHNAHNDLRDRLGVEELLCQGIGRVGQALLMNKGDFFR